MRGNWTLLFGESKGEACHLGCCGRACLFPFVRGSNRSGDFPSRKCRLCHVHNCGKSFSLSTFADVAVVVHNRRWYESLSKHRSNIQACFRHHVTKKRFLAFVATKDVQLRTADVTALSSSLRNRSDLHPEGGHVAVLQSQQSKSTWFQPIDRKRYRKRI